MIPLRRRRDDPHLLVVGMTGVRMGDRVAQIGCAHGGRLAAVAAKVGLSGRAVAVVADETSAARARTAVENAGVLVDIEISPPAILPLESDGFNLVIVDNTGGLLTSMPATDRVATFREGLRALRPGGRIVVISTAARGGLGALFSRASSAQPFDPSPFLEADGFKQVRVLAEKDGLVFVEGVKPRA
jgi:threonine dehydrogenase-like Zn-dependent dehydrogenase